MLTHGILTGFGCLNGIIWNLSGRRHVILPPPSSSLLSNRNREKPHYNNDIYRRVSLRHGTLYLHSGHNIRRIPQADRQLTTMPVFAMHDLYGTFDVLGESRFRIRIESERSIMR